MKRRQKLQRREKLAADRRDRLAAESSKSTAAAAGAAATAAVTTTTAAAAPQQVDIDSLDDPFSSRPPSRSASRASSTHSSQSEDSISPSASASQVREPPREGSSQLASALGGLPQQQQASLSGSASSSAAAPDAFVQPPPPVDALQPSPLHMLTLLGSQLLQHDQKSQQEEQIHEAGLSGIEELFNDLGDEAFEDEAAVVQNEHSSSRVASARPEGTPSSILQHSVAAFSDLKDGDDSTPKGPLTPLHLSQTLQRSLATVKVNTTAPSPSPLSPKMPSLAEHKSATRATDARKMLAQHLTKLFALSASTAPSPALRVLSLHSTHLFRAGTLLTGTLYLTNSHILFYASLRPRAPGAVLQAGALAVARGTGWGWADEAHERHQGQAETSASADGNHGWSAVDSRSPDAVSAPQAGQSRGSFGAAGARLGALLRMPASAIGVGTSASGHQASTNSTSSSSDSARFGTTPTPSTPFGGVQPIQGVETGSQARTAASTAKSTPRRSAPRLRTRHFVLTPRSLSWYASERDPYFPIGQLDLRWIRSVHEGGTTVAEDESAADWYIEYVIPPGPRRVSVDNKRAGARHQIVEDEAERRYSLLLKAPSAEDAKAWCTVVRRAVLRAGGSKSAKVARNDAASGSGGFDVRNDSVRVSIPLRCIVDVEGSVGASGMTSGARQSKSTGKDKQRERDPSVPATVEQDEAEGRTLVIRVWDQDESVAAPTKAGLGTDTAEVAPLDEYYFVDVQRQHELWRRLESAISRIPSVTPSDAAPALEDGRTRASDALGPEEEDLSRTYTERTRSFSYPPSTQPPLPPRTILPRAVSGPAKRLASGLVHTTRPVAAGLGVGATSVKDFMGHQASGLVERVKEAWNVAPAGDDGEDSRGGRAAVAAGQAIPRSRSQSGSEDWQSDDMDLMDTSDEEAGPAADADMDLADSLSFSIVDLPSATPGGGDEDNSGVEIGHSDTSRSPQQRSDLDQHNLELFRRTFVLPLSLPSSNPSDSDPDILRSAIDSPASRSIHSSDLERSTSAERLLATFSSASLYRVLPLAGRLFVSERFLCFRSAKGISSRVNAGIGGLAQGAAGLAAAVSNLAIASAGSGSKFPLQADGRTGSKSMPTAGSGAGGAATGGGRTLMMLPLVDVIGVASNRAYRYGHRGMVVTIRGHEEIFFEFSSKNEQKLCISTIEHQLEMLHRNAGDSIRQPSTSRPLRGQERSDALILKDLGDRLDWSVHSSMHSSFHPGAFAVEDMDAPTQAARRLHREGRLTSPVTSPSSPRLERVAIGQLRGVGGATSFLQSEQMRSRSSSAMSAPGLRSVDLDELASGTGAQHVVDDVSAVDTDTGTTSSSDLLSVASKPRSSLHFTMLTIGSRGDVQPYIALSKRLLTEGHQVRIATHGEFREWIEGHGIEFYEVGGDPAELMRICVENGTFTLSFLKESVTKFRGWLDDLLVSSWKACQGTDVVIESPSAMAGIHIAEALQVPYFRAFTMPWTRTRAYPHAFAVPSGKAGGNYNYMTYVIFDQVFWRASAGQVNRWRRKTLGLRSTNLEEMAQHKVPFLYNFSPSLVPKPLDWYEWIHVTGFWFLDGPDNSKTRQWQPPAELVSFVQRARDAHRKVVYIGWGSIVLSNAEETHQIVVEAVRKTGVCAILSKGWSDRLSKKTKQESPGDGEEEGDGDLSAAGQDDMSERIIEVDSVPHDWLFPQLDAACHHGGAGTLGASLRAGIPTIVKPHFADQFFWGQQVETLGVGGCIRGELTCDKLADALLLATRSEKMVRRARDLGERIRKEDGVGEAIKALYRNLDYATSLIKPGTGLDGRSGGRKPYGIVMPKAVTSGSSSSNRQETLGAGARKHVYPPSQPRT